MIDVTAEMIGVTIATTVELVETTAEIVEMTDVTLGVMATKEETGANHNLANEMSEYCENR